MINDNLHRGEYKEVKTTFNLEKMDNVEIKNKEPDKIHPEMPFFLMTLEDNNGQCQQIKIYKDSDPSELAFNFCKENNLDFSSMKFIKKNVKKIIKKFDEPKQKIVFLDGSNSSIQEVDEENFVTEGTLKSDLMDSESKEVHLQKTANSKKTKKDINSESSLMIQENVNEDEESSQNEEKKSEKNVTEENDYQECSIEKSSSEESNINEEVLTEMKNSDEKSDIDFFFKNSEKKKFQDNSENFNIDEKNSNSNNINNLNNNINDGIKNETETISEEKGEDKNDIIFRKFIKRKHLKNSNIIEINNINNINNITTINNINNINNITNVTDSDFNQNYANNDNKTDIDIYHNYKMSQEHSTISQNKNNSLNISHKNNTLNNNSFNIANSNKNNNNTCTIMSLTNTYNNSSTFNNKQETYYTANNININNYKYQSYNQIDTISSQDSVFNATDKNILNNYFNSNHNYTIESLNKKTKDFPVNVNEIEEIPRQFNTLPSNKKEVATYSFTNDSNKNHIIKNDCKIFDNKTAIKTNKIYTRLNKKLHNNKNKQDFFMDNIELNKSLSKLTCRPNTEHKRKIVPANTNLDTHKLYSLSRQNLETNYKRLSENSKNFAKIRRRGVYKKYFTDFHSNFSKENKINKKRDKILTTRINLDKTILDNDENQNTKTSIFNNWLISTSKTNKYNGLFESQRSQSMSKLLKLYKNLSIDKKEKKLTETKSIKNIRKIPYNKTKNEPKRKISQVKIKNKKVIKQLTEKVDKENKDKDKDKDNNSYVCKTQRLNFSTLINNILDGKSEIVDKKKIDKKKYTITLFINNILNNSTVSTSDRLISRKINYTNKSNNKNINQNSITDKNETTRNQHKKIYQKIDQKQLLTDRCIKNNKNNTSLKKIYIKHDKLPTTYNLLIDETKKTNVPNKKNFRQKNNEIFQQIDANIVTNRSKKLNNHNNKSKSNAKKLIGKKNNDTNNTYLNTKGSKKAVNNNSTYTGRTNLVGVNQKYEDAKKFSDLKNIILNKIFIFFDKDKKGSINLTKNNIEKQIIVFPLKIQKILNKTLNLLISKNKEKSIKKNEFIKQMGDLFSNLSNDDKKNLISYKNEITKMYQLEIVDSFQPNSCFRRFRIDLNLCPLSNKNLRMNKSKYNNFTQSNDEL